MKKPFRQFKDYGDGLHERTAHVLSEHGGAANWEHAMELARQVAAADPALSALRRIFSLRRQIFIDVGARHSARLKTADDLTIQCDANFRRELEEAFEQIASAMSAGTAETQSGSGLQPASAVPNGETPDV